MKHGDKYPGHDPRRGHVNLFDPVSQTWACLTCNVWHHPNCGCDECDRRPLRPATREFDGPHAYQHRNARPTEAAAAQAILPTSAKGRRQVFDHLIALGGMGATDHELAVALGMNPSTVRPRRLELVESGAVVDSGQTRPTPSGRAATVWTVAGGLDSLSARGSGRDRQDPRPRPQR